MKALVKLVKNEKGATAVEYALIAALVAIVAAVGFTSLGQGINNKTGNITTTIG